MYEKESSYIEPVFRNRDNQEQNHYHYTEHKKSYRAQFIISLLVNIVLILIVIFPKIDNHTEGNNLASSESEGTLIADEHQNEEPYNTKNTDLKPLSRPVNKKIFRYSIGSDRPHSTLEIETPYGDVDYYFVVNNLIDTSKNAKFYLYSNSTIEVKMAPGTYEIYYACGSEWYGLEYLFGDQSKCRKFKDTFTFTEECGWTVEMTPVSNGNLSSELVDVSEFPK